MAGQRPLQITQRCFQITQLDRILSVRTAGECGPTGKANFKLANEVAIEGLRQEYRNIHGREHEKHSSHHSDLSASTHNTGTVCGTVQGAHTGMISFAMNCFQCAAPHKQAPHWKRNTQPPPAELNHLCRGPGKPTQPGPAEDPRGRIRARLTQGLIAVAEDNAELPKIPSDEHPRQARPTSLHRLIGQGPEQRQCSGPMRLKDSTDRGTKGRL
jgi:hypothetical protein